MRAAAALVCACACACAWLAAAAAGQLPGHGLGARAYATLLYSDDFDLAVRVLGASLDLHGAAHPRMCLYTEHVSERVVERLAAESWHMIMIPTVDLPPLLQQPQFRYVYSKLAVWNLGRLAGVERVVFLDADILVRRNVDHLFECGPVFCASLRLEGFFNGGVLVLQTNATLYDEMMTALGHERARYAGEQSFLNVWLGPRLRNGTFFGPRGNEGAVGGSGHFRGGGAPTGMQRLAFDYNSDPLIYALSNDGLGAGGRWKMPWDASEIGHDADARVAAQAVAGPALVHYSGEQAKPWRWFPYMFFTQLWEWDAVRLRLDPQTSALYTPAAELANLVLLLVAAAAVCGFAAHYGPRASPYLQGALGLGAGVPGLGSPAAAAALSLAAHALALWGAVHAPGAQVRAYLGYAQAAASYALLLTLLQGAVVIVVTGVAWVPARLVASEALAFFMFMCGITAWRSGHIFSKIGLVGLAVVVLSHAAARAGRRLAVGAAALRQEAARGISV